MTEKLWGGRFSQPTDKFVEEFTASIQFDQRLYRLAAGTSTPTPLTPEPVDRHGNRYADGRFTADGRWVVCVRERHESADAEPINEIVAVRVHHSGEPAEPIVLVSATPPHFAFL